jgi:predicted nucleic acid-binding protein
VTTYILDACALIAFLNDEEGADCVENLLVQAQNDECLLLMHYINLGEVYYYVCRQEGEDTANSVYAALIELPIRFVGISEPQLLTAGQIKATHRMPYADAFAVALCVLESATLVTADRHDFEPLEELGLIPIKWLR